MMQRIERIRKDHNISTGEATRVAVAELKMEIQKENKRKGGKRA